MSGTHLDERQLLALVLGEDDGGARAHLASCQLCREEMASWRRMQAEAGRWQPGVLRRLWVRERVMLRRAPALWWRLALPLAAAVLAVVVSFPRRGQEPADVDAVLEQVDATLAADPLSAVADVEVVSVVIPEVASGERSES